MHFSKTSKWEKSDFHITDILLRNTLKHFFVIFRFPLLEESWNIVNKTRLLLWSFELFIENVTKFIFQLRVLRIYLHSYNFGIFTNSFTRINIGFGKRIWLSHESFPLFFLRLRWRNFGLLSFVFAISALASRLTNALLINIFY